MTITQNNYWQEFKISLKELFLWDENARFPDKYFSKSEEELIEYFCIKKNFKIENLAKEIVKDFDLPQLEKLVVYSTGEQNIVLEGNRRLTVYKLLNNPNLAPNNVLRNKFLEIRKNINIDDSFSFDCLVTDNKAEGFRYIERKHTKRNNEVGWGEQERTNYNVRRGNATDKEEFKIAIAKIIKNLDIPEILKEQVLGPGYVTNFWRILESSIAWKIYGFNLKDNEKLEIKDDNFEKKLKVIILNVLQKQDFSGEKIDSRSLNKNKEKEKYLKSITNDDYDKVGSEIKKGMKNNLFGDASIDVTTIQKRTKINPPSNSRRYLIPKTCRFNINETKINNIYRELKGRLLLDDTNNAVPNAVGVLFRVFLEISLDYYAKINKYGFKKNDIINKKIPWVVNSLIDKGYDKELFNNINKVGSAAKERSYLSIDNFHEYVHSCTTQPSSSELKAKWDNLEEFFEILWKSLQPKK